MFHGDLQMKKNYKLSKTDRDEEETKYTPEYYNIKVSKWQKKRACLKCGNKFHSNGPHNRICEKCNLMNLRIGPARYSLSLRFGEVTSYVEGY